MNKEHLPLHPFVVGDFYDKRIQSLVALVVAPVDSNQSSTFLYSLRFADGHLLVENQRLLQDHTINPSYVIAQLA